MHSFAIVALSSLLSAVSGSPISGLIARESCGTAPSGSTNQAVLAQPSGVQTAAACQTECDNNPSCQSFLFGLVNNEIQCKLFACAASAIPKQESANLLAYNKACASIPSVVPTASNPTGAQAGAAGKRDGTNNGGPVAHRARQTCGGSPTGSGNTAPLSTIQNIASEAACQTQCKANPSCKSFEFGKLTADGENVCRLFSVNSVSVPAPTSGQTFTVFNVGCEL